MEYEAGEAGKPAGIGGAETGVGQDQPVRVRLDEQTVMHGGRLAGHRPDGQHPGRGWPATPHVGRPTRDGTGPGGPPARAMSFRAGPGRTW
ncbi:hypothetical protein GCM10018784_76130 [Streptomyces hydrogenans]|nr:hypothetical protein GCM10018784_76130 [Streptomyces hydrogenans]